MHILIADDERPSRGELRYILEQLASTATFTEASNGQEALDIVAQEEIDVVFLDINMPGINGLSAAAMIIERPNPPFIIFATAYDAHAIRAFELAALDYVVKPFDERRLAQTVVRIRHALSEKNEQQDTQNYLSEKVLPTLTKLWAERENKTAVLVDYGDILWIVAENKQVHIHNQAGEKLKIRHTIKELETRLAAHGFIRVHKAYLVNFNSVSEVVPWFSGTYLIRMSDADKTEIPMSRQYGKALKKLTGG